MSGLFSSKAKINVFQKKNFHSEGSFIRKKIRKTLILDFEEIIDGSTKFFSSSLLYSLTFISSSLLYSLTIEKFLMHPFSTCASLC